MFSFSVFIFFESISSWDVLYTPENQQLEPKTQQKNWFWRQVESGCDHSGRHGGERWSLLQNDIEIKLQNDQNIPQSIHNPIEKKAWRNPYSGFLWRFWTNKQLVVSKSLGSLQGFVEAYPRCSQRFEATGCSRSSGKCTWFGFFFTLNFGVDIGRLVSWYWDPSLRSDHGQFYEEDAQPYGVTSFHTFFLGWAVSTFWDGAFFTLFFITCVNIRTYSLKIFLSVPSQPRPKIAWRPLLTWIFTNEN